ncbi:MAG: hypothetical protein AAFR81_10015 [Chloroflexota bacterium]
MAKYVWGKWIRVKFWHTWILPNQTTWWVIHTKSNPISVRPEPNTDKRLYVAEMDKSENLLREAVLPDTFEAQLTAGKCIKVPMIDVRTGSGLDGEIYGIEIPSGVMGFGSYKMSWWGNSPEEWRELANWYHKTVSDLKQILDDANA